MKFFVDSADINEIKEAVNLGLCDGVTTNPSLVKKAGGDRDEILKGICEIVKGPVNGEVVSMDYEGMVAEGRELAKLAPNIVVKIPMCEDGLKAVKTLSSEGIDTNVTLIFSMTQGLLASKAGATYISPFVGRIDDLSWEGVDLIRELMTMFTNYPELKTEVIVASIRNPGHVVESAMVGAHISTLPIKVFLQMAKHPLTDIGIEKFLADAKS